MSNLLIQSWAYSIPLSLDITYKHVCSKQKFCTSNTLLFGDAKNQESTDLIHNILVDEVTNSHELLRPFLICVSGTQFHGDCAAPCDLTKIVHAEIKKVPLPLYTALLTNFERKAINQNQSFRVIKLYYHEILLKPTNQRQKAAEKDASSKETRSQACVYIMPQLSVLF